MVDKETDKIKAQQQIAKSSFQKLNYDLTKRIYKKVAQWSGNKSFERMEREYC